MKNKIIIIAPVLLVLIFCEVLSVSAVSKDKTNVDNLAKSYVDFSVTFHQLPADKVNIDSIDDSTINQVISNKEQQVNQFAKPGTAFYNNTIAMVTNAIKSQKEKTPKIIAPLNKPLEPANKPSIAAASKPTVNSGIRSFGGFASDLQINNTGLSGSSATVDLSFIAHATFGQWQKDHWVKASPSNKIIEHLAFTKDTSGKWYITNATWQFAPGSEP